jgi:DNA-binding response OmpR family regulator
VFVRARGRILTREQLIAEAWGPNTFVSDRVVDNHIGSLRKKLEPDAAEPRYLRNVRGLGDCFDA